MEVLTQREHEVLGLIIEGHSTKQIAANLGIAFKTAACHRYRIMGKVGALNAADLVRRSIRPEGGLVASLQDQDMDKVVTESCRDIRESRRMLRAELDEAALLREESRSLRSDLREARAELLERCRNLRRLAAL
jgi:DNA-binding CsgD family transcriptional regulator